MYNSGENAARASEVNSNNRTEDYDSDDERELGDVLRDASNMDTDAPYQSLVLATPFRQVQPKSRGRVKGLVTKEPGPRACVSDLLIRARRVWPVGRVCLKMQPYFLASSLFKNKLCRNEEDSSTKFSPPKIAQRSQVRFSILWRSPGRFTAACTGEPARETERSVGSLYCMHGPSALRMPTYSVAVSKFQLPWNLSGFQEPSTTCSPMCAKKTPSAGIRRLGVRPCCICLTSLQLRFQSTTLSTVHIWVDLWIISFPLYSDAATHFEARPNLFFWVEVRKGGDVSREL
ncbi:hypothetical protein PMIN06_007436 [Paraphaeosphaeria minitans]